MLADVAHDFSLEVWDRGKHAARDHVAFDLGETRLRLSWSRAK